MQEIAPEETVARLAAVMAHPNGWDSMLESMAEHPEMAPRAVLALAAFKLDHPGTDTSVVLGETRARSLGGTLVAGAEGFDILVPIAKRTPEGTLTLDGGYGQETVYPAPCFTGLESWPGAAPLRVIEGDPVGTDAFMAASRDVDLEGMDPMAMHVCLLRYGIDDGSAPKAPLVDTDELLTRIEKVCAEVRSATDRIDRALRKAGYEYRPRTAHSQGHAQKNGPTSTMTTKRLKNMLASIDSGRRGHAANTRKGA